MNSKEILFQEPYRTNKIKEYVNESLNSEYYFPNYFEKNCIKILNEKF